MLQYLIMCRTINAEQHGKRINNMKGFNIDSAHTVILGTYPGQKSYKTKKYYSDVTNCFWQLLGIKYQDYEELKSRGIGLWDVIKSCDTKYGGADKSIKNPKYNDLSVLDGKRIFFNGKKIYVFYKRTIRQKKIKALERFTILAAGQILKSQPKKNKWHGAKCLINKMGNINDQRTTNCRRFL